MRVTCPLCGSRDLREFTIRGAAGLPGLLEPEVTPEQIEDALYLRDNPAGPTRELWYHEGGCRQWLVVNRNTISHAVTAVSLLAQEGRA